MKRIGSVEYYSPNSIVNAILDPHASLGNPFRPGSQQRVRFTDLVTTRPWSEFFGWTSFIPLDDCYQFSPKSLLSALVHTPPIETLRNEAGGIDGFRLVRDNQWRVLEQNVYQAVCALKCAFHLPCVLPFLPHALGYDSTYTNKAQLRLSIAHSREWFLVWIGALSYCLYASEIYPDHLSRQPPYPRWRKALEHAGLSSAWIDEMIHSPIADYNSLSVRRVGCIIDLLHPDPGQPDVDWFLNAGVPVWYPWGKAEDREVGKRPEFAAHRPPAQIIPFQGIPGLGKLPSMGFIEPVQEANADTKVGKDEIATQREPEWMAFLRERENRGALIQSKENAKQRQARENRTRNPPTCSARVFEWTTSEEGGVNTWTRVPVPARWRADTLTLYASNRKRYDPIFNEWDCCDDFGDATGEEGEEEAEDAGEIDDHVQFEHSTLPPSTDSPVASGEHLRPALVLPSPNHASLPVLDPAPDLFQPDEPSGQEVDETFRLFYGYTPPPPTTLIPETKDTRRRDLFFRLLGQRYRCLEVERLAYFLSKPYLPVQYLVNCILDRTNDYRGVWDLCDDCVCPARFKPRFGMLRRLQVGAGPAEQVPPSGSDLCETVDNYFVLEDPSSPVPWKLAFISASAALTACRLPDDFTPFDIAAWMVQRGVPFRCFYPAPRFPRPLLQPTRCFNLLVRPFHHTFTKEDYHSYVHLRTLILGQPHMQAALKRGGIVWRLAIGTLGISKILQLPSLWHRTRRVTLGGVEFEDDGLTMNELDLICGAYECISSDGKQRSLKSWWPLARYYEKEECGENYGRWCSRREAWYEERLACIENGDSTAKPLSYTEWKSSQHGPRLIRTFHSAVEKASFDLLRRCPPPGYAS
ncbi:hypothetical protein FA13DRAFT_1633621 [Coprinellus micaceus]|uniref:Uncharacterized protein n=1 Tax=Coprinellus micaceus TaxID=71717 RepID=A0A4Y7T1J2_COPMI|nr:hypothetical protein FA13DRAFT_1633621 [Coprinellus micaceus]